jgi:hypothetical protein
MKKLGTIIGKAVSGTKKSAKGTVPAVKHVVTSAKSSVVNAKTDFVAGYKEQTIKPIELPEI